MPTKLPVLYSSLTHTILCNQNLVQPAVCEAHPDAAAALNVPTKLLDSLEQHKAAKGCDPLLIHFSTDQVQLSRFGSTLDDLVG